MNETIFKGIEDCYVRNKFSRGGEKVNVLEQIQLLEDKKISTTTGDTLYHLAARYLDLDTINYLHQEGIKPRTNDRDQTPLHYLVQAHTNEKDYAALAEAIYKCTMALIKAGVNPKKKNQEGIPAYWKAGEAACYPFIQAMADTDIKVDQIGEEGKNLLHVLCYRLVHRKNIEGVVEATGKTIQVILAHQLLDPEDKDIFDRTPIYYAQSADVKEIAAILSGDALALVTGGMDLNQAVLNRDLQAVQALLNNGEDINQLFDSNGRSALMLACEYPNPEMVELLLKHQVDVNLKSGANGTTAVYYLLEKAIYNLGRGVQGGQTDRVIRQIFQLLLDSDLQVNDTIHQHDGTTALMHLVRNQQLSGLMNSMVEDLIDADCNLNQTNNSGQTALMLFAFAGNEDRDDIVELLLDNDVDISLLDKESNTALMYAALNHNAMSAKKIGTLLLDADASIINQVNNQGKTALDLAVEQNNEALVKVILNKM